MEKLTQDAFIRTGPLAKTFNDKSAMKLLKGVAKHHAENQLIQTE
jgi:hypothetical protein